MISLLTSCASVSVVNSERRGKEHPRKVPDKILVRPFVFDEAVLRVGRSGEALEVFKYDAREKMTRHLVSRLSKHVAPAEAIAATAPLPRGNIWLVEGRIDRMHQGSRLARSVVGFGLGGTKMEVSAVVYDLSGRRPEPFLVVQTSGGSNASPGAIGSVGFFVSGITALTSLGNLIEGLRTGLTFDTARTAKEITATTSEFLYQQRAIPYEKALAPKRQGEWKPDFWPFSRRPERLPEGSLKVVPVDQEQAAASN